MRYQKISPSELLKEHIKWFFILDSNQLLERPLMINSTANCAYALVFNYGNRHRIFNSFHQGLLLPRCFLSGISTVPYRMQYEGRLSMAGVIFNGLAFMDLFNIPPRHELINNRMDAYHLLGAKADELIDRLAFATSNHDRITILEHFFIQFIQKKQTKIDPVDQAAKIILSSRGMVRMDQVANQVNLSPRQLRRKFSLKTGIGPKGFSRIKRFNFVNHMLAKNPDLSWYRFLNDGGYYDQSHLIKDYQEFSGHNPSVFIDNTRSAYHRLLSP